MNILNRNEDELEVLCNLGGINLSEEGESITEEYKKVMKQDESMKEWKKLAETKDKGLRLVDGVLKKQYKDNIHGLKELLVIPKGMRARLVSMAHDYCGHVGTDKVTWTLRQNFTWPGMYKQIKTYCQQCDSGQKARRENERKIPMGEMPLHSKPFENVAVDLVGPHQGPEKYCLIFSEEQVEDDFLPEEGDVGNLTYSLALVNIIVFYVIYYTCTVLRISYIADYVL